MISTIVYSSPIIYSFDGFFTNNINLQEEVYLEIIDEIDDLQVRDAPPKIRERN